MFSLENNKFWSAGRLEPMNSHELTALTDCATRRSFNLKIYGEIVIYNTNYAFDGWNIRAPAFFLFFFTKNKKDWPARKMMRVFILFILLVKKLLLRTDAIPNRPYFIYKRLSDDAVIRSILKQKPHPDVVDQGVPSHRYPTRSRNTPDTDKDPDRKSVV